MASIALCRDRNSDSRPRISDFRRDTWAVYSFCANVATDAEAGISSVMRGGTFFVCGGGIWVRMSRVSDE